MKKYVPYMMAGSLMAAIMLAGCSSNTDTTAASANSAQTAQTQTGTDSQSTEPGASTGNGQNGMNRTAMNFGKIKSISGNTITIYTAQMPADRPQNAGAGTEGTAPNDGGTATGAGTDSGQTQQGQGTASESGGQGSGQSGRQGGGRQGGGGGMRGGGMMQNFSEETTDITISSDTKFVSVTFDNGTQQETAISLADLKADDIIQYTLKSDTTEAEKITLSSGNFGGGGQPEAMSGASETAPDSGSTGSTSSGTGGTSGTSSI